MKGNKETRVRDHCVSPFTVESRSLNRSNLIWQQAMCKETLCRQQSSPHLQTQSEGGRGIVYPVRASADTPSDLSQLWPKFPLPWLSGTHPGLPSCDPDPIPATASSCRHLLTASASTSSQELRILFQPLLRLPDSETVLFIAAMGTQPQHFSPNDPNNGSFL